MAERRMFTKKVTDDDNFMALSASAQALYLHLSMSADDDGFCNQVSISMFKAHASVQDLQALLEKRYIYQFENGVIVIKHWRMANALRKDRYTPTAFQEELSHLDLKDNGSYTWLPNGCHMVAECLPQDSIDKNSIDKSSIGKDNIPPISPKGGKAKEKTETVYYPDDEKLNQAFADFVEMRKKIKKPMTERAVMLAMNKLKKLSEVPFADSMDNDLAIQILEQSTMNCWRDLYPLKDNSNKRSSSGGVDWDNV